MLSSYCCFVKLCNSFTLHSSDEAVKQCLSHQYVMKLHRHTSQENDEMRTHEWPQFVQDDLEHDDIYIMDEFICICCRNSLQKKMPDQACANGLQLHDIPQDLQNNAIGEKSDFSMICIHKNTYYKMTWWPLQSKWSTCQCSSNTRSNYRNIALHAQ